MMFSKKSALKARRALGKRMVAAFITGVLAMLSGNSDKCAFGKQPPPPYYPPFSESFVVKKLMGTPYGKALKDNKIKIIAATFRGYNMSPTHKELILDLGLELCRSPLGVRYRLSHSVWVDWQTGDLPEAEDESKDLLEFLNSVANAIARAEMLPEVKEFVRQHQGKRKIEAEIWSVGTNVIDCYRFAYTVSFSKKNDAGEGLNFEIYPKDGKVEDMYKVYVSKDGERKEVQLR
jgi:hypothetical protein